MFRTTTFNGRKKFHNPWYSVIATSVSFNLALGFCTVKTECGTSLGLIRFITKFLFLHCHWSFIAAVKRIADEILVSKLADVSYEPNKCRDLTLQISDEVKSQVKLLGFERYKIVCITHIGPKMGQAIRIGSMCCWDEKADNFAECSFINSSLFAVALVFGVYQE